MGWVPSYDLKKFDCISNLLEFIKEKLNIVQFSNYDYEKEIKKLVENQKPGYYSISLEIYQNTDLKITLNIDVNHTTELGGKRGKNTSKNIINFCFVNEISFEYREQAFKIKYNKDNNSIVFILPDGDEYIMKEIPSDFDVKFFDGTIGFIKRALATDNNKIAADFFGILVKNLFALPEYHRIDQFVRCSKQFEDIQHIDDRVLAGLEKITKIIWGISVDKRSKTCSRKKADGRVISYSLVSLLKINADGSYHFSSPSHSDDSFGFDVSFGEDFEILSLEIGGNDYDKILIKKQPFEFRISTYYYNLTFEDESILFTLKNRKREDQLFELKKVDLEGYSITNNISVDYLLETFPEIVETMRELHLLNGRSYYLESFPVKIETAKKLWSRLLSSYTIQKLFINCVSLQCGGYCKEHVAATSQLLQIFGNEQFISNVDYINLRTLTDLIPTIKYTNGVVSNVTLGQSNKHVEMSYINDVPKIEIHWLPCGENKRHFSLQITREKDVWKIEYTTLHSQKVGLFEQFPKKLLGGDTFKKVLNQALDCDNGYDIYTGMAKLMPKGFRDSISNKNDLTVRENEQIKSLMPFFSSDVSIEQDDDGFSIADRNKASAISITHNGLNIRCGDNHVYFSFFEDYPSIHVSFEKIHLNIFIENGKYKSSIIPFTNTPNALAQKLLNASFITKNDISIKDGFKYAMNAINSPVIKEIALTILANILECLGGNKDKVDELYQVLLTVSGIKPKIKGPNTEGEEILIKLENCFDGRFTAQKTEKGYKIIDNLSESTKIQILEQGLSIAYAENSYEIWFTDGYPSFSFSTPLNKFICVYDGEKYKLEEKLDQISSPICAVAEVQRIISEERVVKPDDKEAWKQFLFDMLNRGIIDSIFRNGLFEILEHIGINQENNLIQILYELSNLKQYIMPSSQLSIMQTGELDNNLVDLQRIFANIPDLSIQRTSDCSYSVDFRRIYHLVKVSKDEIKIGDTRLIIKLQPEFSLSFKHTVHNASYTSYDFCITCTNNTYNYYQSIWWEDYLQTDEHNNNYKEALNNFLRWLNLNYKNSQCKSIDLIKSNEFSFFIREVLILIISTNIYQCDTVIYQIDELMKIIYRISGLDKYIELGTSLVLSEVNQQNPQ